MASQAQLKQPAPGTGGGPADPDLAGIETTYDKARGTLTVNLPGEVLFESGKAVLKASAHTTLDKIANAIKKAIQAKPSTSMATPTQIRVTKTKDTWEDNWDLAGARANAVQDLATHGVSEKNMNLRTFGPNRPKGSKPQSRRVEIVVQVG